MNKVLLCVIIIFSSISGIIGLSYLGYFSIPLIKRGDIHVYGHAERLVDSDFAEIVISISDDKQFDAQQSSLDDRKELAGVAARLGEDKAKIMKDIKQFGMQDTAQETEFNVQKTYQNKRVVYQGRVVIKINTKDVDSAEKLRQQVSERSKEGMSVACECFYKVLDLEKERELLLAAASVNALHTAKIVASKCGQKISKLNSLHQHGVEILAATEVTSYYYNREEQASKKKKLRVVVSASFSHE